MKSMTNLLLAAMLICFSTFTLQAQDDDATHYYDFGYMKVEPGMHEDYLALEKAWKKIHQHNVNAGHYTSWELCRVLSPNGSNVEYNYVTRTSILGEKQLANYMENFSFPDNIESLLTADELKMVMNTEKYRAMVKTEIWSRMDHTLAEDMTDANLHVYNFFDFPEGKDRSDHVAVEREIWKPVHEARIKAGEAKGWVLLGKQFPFGSALPYHDATVDVYTGIEQRMMPWVENYFKKVHEGKDLEALFDATTESSDLVRADVRMVVDRTTPKPAGN